MNLDASPPGHLPGHPAFPGPPGGDAAALRAALNAAGNAAVPPTRAGGPALDRRGERSLGLEFTGRGGDYFRIWIVNLLLTLVTLGLYHPWARARKLRYFYGNTRLDGHAFDFHGQPRRMLRGLLLVGGLFLAYGIAREVSPWAGLLALALICALWPALLHGGWSFRLGQTSWRGLRFRFAAGVSGAYRSLVPALLGLLLALGLQLALVLNLAPMEEPGPMVAALVALPIVAYGLCVPYFIWRVQAYIHGGFGYAALRSRFDAGPGALYGVVLRALGIVVLMAIAWAAITTVASLGAGAGAQPAVGAGAADAEGAAAGRQGLAAALAGAILLGTLLFYAAVLLVLRPYVMVRMQNLLWSGTHADELHIESRVSARSAIALSLMNGLLIVLTLGLYWPFAAVRMARLRLSGVQLHTRLDFDALTDRQPRRSNDASGDAAADLAGFDIGL